MHVNMYVCIHAHTHMYMYVHTYMHIYRRKHEYMQRCSITATKITVIYLGTHINTCMHTYIHPEIQTIRMRTKMFRYSHYDHSYLHTYIYTYIHTYIRQAHTNTFVRYEWVIYV
jgi:hypothetical protein